MGTSTRYLVPGTRYVVHKMHMCHTLLGLTVRSAYCTVLKSAGKYFKVLCSERFQDSPFTCLAHIQRLLQKMVLLDQFPTLQGHSNGVLKLGVLLEQLDNAW
jgi:hypothetical protein